jgi:hypothetical protein
MEIAKKLWIQNSWADTIFYSFGWIVIFTLLLMFQNNYAWIILVVLMFNYVHRHYTFALVYGENEEFNRRRLIYIALPISAIIVTFIFIKYDSFKILLTISIIWTMYHTVAQKYGLTRIYSRKAGYGEARTELGVIYSWFVFLFFFLAVKDQQIVERYRAGRVILGFFGEYMQYVQVIAYVAMAVCIYFTVRYIYIEIRNRHQISIPKNIYVISIILLFSIFLYSLVIGYIVFAFSHALEYIAFVNFFVSAKYKKRPEHKSLLARASKKLWIYSTLFAIIVILASLYGRQWNMRALEIYIVGSSFLHFIYDGMIWKIRRPEVGKPLEIKYTSN